MNKIFLVILLLDAAISIWAISYMVTYSSQNKIGSLAFAIVFGVGMLCFNWLAQKTFDKK